MNRSDENRFIAEFMDERRKEFHMDIDKEEKAMKRAMLCFGVLGIVITIAQMIAVSSFVDQAAQFISTCMR